MKEKESLPSTIFGKWKSETGGLSFKIVPNLPWVRIMIAEVISMTELHVLFTFAGLKTIPNRTHWKNFDLVTNLRKDGKKFQSGDLLMPHTRRHNRINLQWINEERVRLDFYFADDSEREFFHTGSFVLHRDEA